MILGLFSVEILKSHFSEEILSEFWLVLELFR